jgi:hypothetical protein
MLAPVAAVLFWTLVWFPAAVAASSWLETFQRRRHNLHEAKSVSRLWSSDVMSTFVNDASAYRRFITFILIDGKHLASLMMNTTSA